MAIPLSYNLRNLVVRKTTTIMTALGIALTVAVLLAVLALVSGLRTAFESTGDPLHILVMRKGSNAELSSGDHARSFPGPEVQCRASRATPTASRMASLEMVTVINLPSVDSPEGMNVTLRGHPAAWAWRCATALKHPGRPLVPGRAARGGGGQIHRQALPRRPDGQASCASAGATGKWWA